MSRTSSWVLSLVLAIGMCAVILSWTQYVFSYAYEKGKMEVDWRTRLLEDQKLANQACTAWWFLMDHKERRVQKPKQK